MGREGAGPPLSFTGGEWVYCALILRTIVYSLFFILHVLKILKIRMLENWKHMPTVTEKLINNKADTLLTGRLANDQSLSCFTLSKFRQ